MRKFILALSAVSLAVPAAMVLPSGTAEAQSRHHQRHASYREWRGRDGRLYCRRSNGTTGLVVGAAAGALVGHAIDSHGERTTGTVLGALAGGLLGRDVARNRSQRRCR
jgi:outer membrane lipoprotein SlyB